MPQDGNAEQATSLAQAALNAVNPGVPGHAVLVRLASPSGNDANRERDLLVAIASLGLGLQVPLETIEVLESENNYVAHTVIPIAKLAVQIFESYPQKLLFGHTLEQLPEIHSRLRRFWRIFKQVRGSHPVFLDHRDHLHWCLPMKAHVDEGTGLRKAAMLQVTWGPVIFCEDASWSRYFFWSCMGQEQYKAQNAGYEAGNASIDSLMHHFTLQACQLYDEGVQVRGFNFKFVFVGLEADLPAQAKIFHLHRNWQCSPNRMCPWCNADDGLCPATDINLNARWRQTICTERPWSELNCSPMSMIPGAGTEEFLLKDVFHICSLGIARTFVASLLCCLVLAGHFEPEDPRAGNSIPARLAEAYKQFRWFCKMVLHETPHIKHFSRDNFSWMSRQSMPESTMKASDCRLMLRWLVDYTDRPLLLDAVLHHAVQAACGNTPSIKN